MNPKPRDSGQRQSRIGHTKSRNGCTTCKIRKIKCDEGKPLCRPCTSTGRKCSYPLSSSTSLSLLDRHRQIVPERSLCSLNSSIRERQAFQFFFEVGIPAFSGTLDRLFWSRTILQLSRTESFIWDAVIAISSLVRHPKTYTSPLVGDYVCIQDRETYHEEAWNWYHRAISKIQEQLRLGVVSNYIAIVSCVLFICLEILNDNIEGAYGLYLQGSALISGTITEHSSGNFYNALELRNSVQPMFHHIKALAITSGRVTPDLKLRLDSRPAKSGFSNLKEARMTWYGLMGRAISFDRSVNQLGDSVPHRKYDSSLYLELESNANTLRAEVEEWYRQFVELGITPEGTCSSSDKFDSALLISAHAGLEILLAFFPRGSQMVTDRYTNRFAKIVNLSRFIIETSEWDVSNPSFIPEIGIAIPLYVTATKCRHPRIRREALQQLKEIPKTQALYKSTPYEKLASEIIKLEEGGGEEQQFDFSPDSFPGEYNEAEFVPESRRIGDHITVYSEVMPGSSKKQWCMKFTCVQHRREQAGSNVPQGKHFTVEEALAPL